MAGAFVRSLKSIFGLVKRDNIRREYKARLAEFDRQFLMEVTSPEFEDGRLHRKYRDGISKIRNWYDIENRKV